MIKLSISVDCPLNERRVVLLLCDALLDFQRIRTESTYVENRYAYLDADMRAKKSKQVAERVEIAELVRVMLLKGE